MKNRTLWLLFGLLLGAFILSRFLNKKPQRSFTEDIIQIDPASIDKINMHPKPGTGQAFSLTKDGENWRVSNGTIEAEAVTEVVETLLKTANEIKANRIVAKATEKWPTYEVDESNGRRIEFMSGSKQVEEIVLGRFDFNQEARTAKSHIRHMDDINVYVIDGFLGMSLGGDINSFRNKNITSLTSDNIESINYRIASGPTTNIRKENTWVDQNNQVVDSISVESYLSTISNLNGAIFIDNFNDISSSKINSITIQQSVDPAEITIDCYHVEGQAQPFVIHSSANPTSYFGSDSSGIYSALYTNLPSQL